MVSQAEFVIRPNTTYHSKSWHKTFLILVIICLSIAIRFALLGYWMILPFAVIDVIVVGLLLHWVVRQSAYTEKVIVDDKIVEIQHIQKNKNAKWQFPLHWIQVKLESPQYHWYPHRLLLGSKGEWVEIGQCLTNDERKSLAEAIHLRIRQTT